LNNLTKRVECAMCAAGLGVTDDDQNCAGMCETKVIKGGACPA